MLEVKAVITLEVLVVMRKEMNDLKWIQNGPMVFYVFTQVCNQLYI